MTLAPPSPIYEKHFILWLIPPRNLNLRKGAHATLALSYVYLANFIYNMYTPVTQNTSHVTRHKHLYTCHTSHVTRHTSQVTRHTSHVRRPPHMTFISKSTHVTRHTSHVAVRTSQYERRSAHVAVHTSHVTHHTSHVIRHVTRHTSRRTSHVIRHTLLRGYVHGTAVVRQLVHPMGRTTARNCIPPH